MAGAAVFQCHARLVPVRRLVIGVVVAGYSFRAPVAAEARVPGRMALPAFLLPGRCLPPVEVLPRR